MPVKYLYYTLKPFIPRRLRLAARSFVARQKLQKINTIWPILPGSEVPPKNWPGWPDGRQFAFVLSHDVEGPVGLTRVRELADLEMSLGFRSSFNFIPEGSYTVPVALRSWLTDNGFEVGVHDLNHDGWLYRSRRSFCEKATRINRWLKEWNAVGFRSGFMLHNLDWQRELDALYDASTFDTDPFEPQPDGVGTIFPFHVSGTSQRKGFMELPYTLAQDSTLFLLLKEKNNEIWRKKTSWVAGHGGMVLLNLHPDYVAFNGVQPKHGEFSVELYADFLQFVSREFSGRYWHALPREVAGFGLRHRASLRQVSPVSQGIKIWIDLENTPHIPFFNPIIKELRKRGHTIILTARDGYQTCEMADLYGMEYTRIGHHYGKRMILKALGLGVRVLQLFRFVILQRPALGLNHGSRAQTIICNLFRIPNVMISDYEHTLGPGIGHPQWDILPEVLAIESVISKINRDKFLTYAGIKEDVYVSDLKPDPAILEQLKLKHSKVIITVRPPATEAHYHNPETNVLFTHFMNRAVNFDGAKVVLLPRNKRQETQLKNEFPHWFKDGKVVIPDTVVEGMNLLWFSDLVVSGGGTMNREAAALGVPVYSIFRGTIGAVDQYLQAEGRLTIIENITEVEQKIRIEPRTKTTTFDSTPRQALSDIVNNIECIIDRDCRS